MGARKAETAYARGNRIIICILLPSNNVMSCFHPCRGYSNTELRPTVEFNDHGFPIYARPTIADLTVVPHNRDMLLDWKGHCNVEFTTLTYTCCYLYKYLFKGNKKTKVSFLQTNKQGNSAAVDADADADEKKAYIMGRVTCAMSAFWTFLGYQTYPATEPTVYLLDVKLPAQVAFLDQKKQLCDLSVYFLRPVQLQHLRYAEMYSTWQYDREQPSRPPENLVYQVEHASGRPIYYYKLRDANKRITRMQKIPFGTGNNC